MDTTKIPDVYYHGRTIILPGVREYVMDKMNKNCHGLARNVNRVFSSLCNQSLNHDLENNSWFPTNVNFLSENCHISLSGTKKALKFLIADEAVKINDGLYQVQESFRSYVKECHDESDANPSISEQIIINLLKNKAVEL